MKARIALLTALLASSVFAQDTMPGMNMGTPTAPITSPSNHDQHHTATAPDISTLPETPISTVTRMGHLVMPPGMIMTPDQSMEAMQDMAAVDLGKVTYTAPATARGDQPLQPKLVGGVKVFNLETSLIRWNILPNVQVAAYAINKQVPGPRLRITQGDRVRFIVKNNLPDPTSLHWHGLSVPNNMDGSADVTQKPIPPGGTFTYEFTVTQAGTFFYHSHKAVDRQQGLGLYGALIVDPKRPDPTLKADKEYTLQLQEWKFTQGYTFPAMPMEGLMPNYFTINGKSYPSTEVVKLKVGQTVRLRFIGSQNNFIHPMHIHGGPFTVAAIDGATLAPAVRYQADTINVGPGQRYDVLWKATRKGTWLIHCHIPHHITNNNEEVAGGGGLTMAIMVN